MDFGDRSDNPFSVSFHSARSPRKQALKSAIRFFVLVCLCLAVTLGITSQGPKWLVYRLTHDFASLTGPEKKERLTQISDLGPAAIPSLTQSLADPDLEVARTAYELLQQAQNNWSILEAADQAERQALLVHSLASIAARLPDDRTGWGTSLLQQTVMATVADKSDDARRIYREANHVIELLSLTGRSRSTGFETVASASLTDSERTDSESEDPRQPKRLAVRAQPLPVDQSRAAESWTQWPPAIETRFEREPLTAGSPPGGTVTVPAEESERMAGSPTVYRSGSKLQPIGQGDGVALRPMIDPPETSTQGVDLDRPGVQSVDRQDAGIQPVAHLVDSPLETYDDQSVMRWLGSEHAALREKAESELVRRGYRQAEIAIATQIASADSQTRLELVNAIAHSGTVDPRPWLLMLLDDPNRDVKLRVISVLATMNDPAITQRLQLHLADESDPTVAARIRRVLKLR